MSPSKEGRIRLTLLFIKQFDELARRNCTLAEWVALKFGCSVGIARRRLAEAAYEKSQLGGAS